MVFPCLGEKLYVYLSGTAKEAQSTKEGWYTRNYAPYKINEKPNWSQEDGSNVIWHEGQTWNIGEKQSGRSGIQSAGIQSIANAENPLEVKYWKYASNGMWRESVNIHVESGDVTGIKFLD